MSLFSEIEKMGLGGVNLDNVFKEEQKQTAKKSEVIQEPVKTVLREEDVLFDKSFQCPVCDNNFKVKAIRVGKLKMIDQGEDLRPIYENGIEPLKYDAVTCTKCGYTALTRYYMALTNAQLRVLKQDYCAHFKGIPEENPCMSYTGALLRHKLALVCSMKRNAKNSEKAYIFLKMAWLMQSKISTMPEDSDKLDELKKDEYECMQKAYEGFTVAFSKEEFPMCGIDEITLRYMMAVMARRLGRLEEAVRWLAGVLQSRTAPQRIKDKALDLKTIIKSEVAAGKTS
jgi:hypothetical protein